MQASENVITGRVTETRLPLLVYQLLNLRFLPSQKINVLWSFRWRTSYSMHD